MLASVNQNTWQRAQDRMGDMCNPLTPAEPQDAVFLLSCRCCNPQGLQSLNKTTAVRRPLGQKTPDNAKQESDKAVQQGN